jgi:hypothetical protein
MKLQRHILLVLTILALAIATVIIVSPNRANYSLAAVQGNLEVKDLENEDLPVVTYEGSNPNNSIEPALRKAKNKRYDGKTLPVKEEPGIEPLPINSHWWWGMPALPSNQSDVVVVGEVVKAEAFISDSKTGVYSEFTFRVEEVLKNNNHGAIGLNSLIVADRVGGAVRFPSGRIYKYRVNKQRMPKVGQRYLIFLKYNEEYQSFVILTGYKFHNGKVIALDGQNNDLPFTTYNGVEETNFLNKVKETVATPEQVSPEKGVQRQ